MKRPYLVHFLALLTDRFISIKSFIALKEQDPINSLIKKPKDPFPIQEYSLLKSHQFQIKLIGYNQQRIKIFTDIYTSDNFGKIDLKIYITNHQKNITTIQVYEIKQHIGIEFYLGTFIPLKIFTPKKIIICDFDKTLVETKYSTPRELYRSLVKPLDRFPTIVKSLNILKKYIAQDFHPFILSASPHFYEKSIRNWLYKRKVFTAGIFLKDYRDIFNFFKGNMGPKDIKAQGLYKLDHLLNILIMTDIPNELVLIGDNFESDPIIYLSLRKLIYKEIDPWSFWNLLDHSKTFIMNKKQKMQLLNKIYQFSNYIKKWEEEHPGNIILLTIYIRKKTNDEKTKILPELKKDIQYINFYTDII